jgi:hypothetical protein
MTSVVCIGLERKRPRLQALLGQYHLREQME